MALRAGVHAGFVALAFAVAKTAAVILSNQVGMRTSNSRVLMWLGFDCLSCPIP